MTKREWEIPTEVLEVGNQIALWRDSREKRTAMPEELWRAAAELAQRHGVYRICRALRLSYESLKRRVLDLAVNGTGEGVCFPGFAVLDPKGMGQAPTLRGVEVEVSRLGGERMVIRFEGGEDVDVASLVAGIWRQGR